MIIATATANATSTTTDDPPTRRLEWDKAKAFAPAALIFVATILLNMKSLEYANVVSRALNILQELLSSLPMRTQALHNGTHSTRSNVWNVVRTI